MSNVVALKDPEALRKAAVTAIPRCTEVLRGIESKTFISKEDFAIYRKTKMIRDACHKVLSA